MSSGTGQWDAALIDLFRSEVETHSETLNTALLALERTPGDTSRIDEMMRAAHSIKGASRVVGVDLAVRVAHVMEDCFVAAQRGTLALAPADVDVLLRGVDLLGKISAATRDVHSNLADSFTDVVQTLVGELQDVLAGRAASGSSSPPQGTAGTGSEPSSVSSAVALADAPAASQSGTPAPRETVTAAATANDVTISFPALLNSSAAEDIRKQFLSAIDSQCETIRFDLAATKDLDVQGLALLAATPRHLARNSRSSLRLAGISREMATVLRVTGLSEQFGIRSSSA